MQNYDYVEKLHDFGKMPDWIYYQLSRKPAEEALNQQHKKMIEKIQQEQAEKDLEEELQSKAQNAIEKALNELFKDF